MVRPAVRIPIPPGGLVLLVGQSGSGKSTFARRHFRSSEILSSDELRRMVSDDENDQRATRDAFAALHLLAAARLRRGRLTVIDATNLRRSARQPLLDLAAERRRPAVAIVFDLPPAVVAARNRQRSDRRLPDATIEDQRRLLAAAIRDLPGENLPAIVILGSEAAVDGAWVDRLAPRSQRLRQQFDVTAQPRRAGHDGGDGNRPDDRRQRPAEAHRVDRRDDVGPFDIVGDAHGCGDELLELLDALGHRVEREAGGDRPRWVLDACDGRKVVFLGDLVDRGPSTPEVLAIAMAVARSGQGYALLGNHDWKLLRALWGRNVRVSHGLAESLEQLDRLSPEFRAEVVAFLESLPAHLVLDRGRLVVAHAGLPAALHGSRSARARDFALYGETTGESDEFGLPVRVNWTLDYAGPAAVVYGHTAVREPEWVNDTIDIDTGCVFGGRLTALRWPERQLVTVPARKVYYEPGRPMLERIDHRPYLGGAPA